MVSDLNLAQAKPQEAIEALALSVLEDPDSVGWICRGEDCYGYAVRLGQDQDGKPIIHCIQ